MDYAAQHLKALEQAVTDGSWDRARFLNLLPEESATLVGRSERYMMRAEARAEQQLAGMGEAMDKEVIEGQVAPRAPTDTVLTAMMS